MPPEACTVIGAIIGAFIYWFAFDNGWQQGFSAGMRHTTTFKRLKESERFNGRN